MSAPIACELEGHEPSTNPRETHLCVRCHKPIPNAQPPIARDSQYETRFLQEVVKAAEKQHGIFAPGFMEAVKARLEMGEKRYKGAYLQLPEHERLREIREELWDVAAYSVLDAQVRVNADVDDSAAYHLFELAAGALKLDWHVQQLGRPDL